MIILHEHRAAVFGFLDQLYSEDRGKVFGAAPIVQERFGVSAAEARELHVAWMNSFSFDRSPEERAADVTPAPEARFDHAAQGGPPLVSQSKEDQERRG